MINLDRYKQLLALTNFQYEQARQLISEFTQRGIFLPMPPKLERPEQLFLDSKINFKYRKELYSTLQFRHYTLAVELEYQVAALLCELNLTSDNSQEVRALFQQILLETTPFIKRRYSTWEIDESEYRAPDFNLILMWYTRTVLNSWAIPTSLWPAPELPSPEEYEEIVLPISSAAPIDSNPTGSQWGTMIELQKTLRTELNTQAEFDFLATVSNDTNEISDELVTKIGPVEQSQVDQ